MHSVKFLAALIAVSVFAFSSHLFAQNDSIPEPNDIPVNPTEVKTVVIYGPYSAGQDYPFSYTDLRLEQIEEQNYGQEPSFLLSSTPSVTVYSDAGSYQGYSYFRMRGIDQTRINMSLNGVPLNEPEDQGAYFSNYPDFLNSINSIQIQRGVGTSKNGTAAYAGSMQFYGPSFYDSTYKEIGLGYGSYNSYRAYGEMNLNDVGKKGIYLRASHLHADGFKDNSENTSTSGFYQGYWKKNNHHLSLTGFAGTQKNQMAWLGAPQDSLNENPRFNANAPEEDDRFSQSLTMLSHKYIGSRFITSSAVYYNFLDGNYDFDFNNFLGLPSTNEMYNYAFRSHFGGAFANVTYYRGNLQLTTGLHANTYRRRHLGSEASLGELYRNTGFRQDASVFLKGNYKLFQNKIILFGDLQGRYTRFAYEGSVPLAPLDWSFFNPKIGLTWHPRKHMDVYYSIGRTGREPTRNDIFMGSDDLYADSLGLPLLGGTSAEYVSDQELGFRIRKPRWSASANLYYMDFRNEIVLNGQFGPNGLALTQNVDQSYRAGLEIEAQWKINEYFSLSHGSAFNTSQITQDEVSFSPILTPGVVLNQGATFTWKKFSLSLDARYQGASWLDFANTEQLDGYFLLNARTSYQLGPVQLILRVNNLTNAAYYNNGYVDFDLTPKYFLQAPTNFRASAVWRF
jgi:iron complex outermembrane receptor protein